MQNVKIFRLSDYKMPPEIDQFIKENGHYVSSENWYSEKGQLKIGK